MYKGEKTITLIGQFRKDLWKSIYKKKTSYDSKKHKLSNGKDNIFLKVQEKKRLYLQDNLEKIISFQMFKKMIKVMVRLRSKGSGYQAITNRYARVQQVILQQPMHKSSLLNLRFIS